MDAMAAFESRRALGTDRGHAEELLDRPDYSATAEKASASIIQVITMQQQPADVPDYDSHLTSLES